MFMVRLALAALSVGNWGIYGPAMELLEATPRDPGSEEYIDSEKYEIKRWNLDAPESLAPFIRQLNTIRREEVALARNRRPIPQAIDDPHLLAWTRFDAASGSRVLVVVNLEAAEARSGLLTFDPDTIGLDGVEQVIAHDLLTGATHAWDLAGITIECTPDEPVRVFRLVPA
jgi:starch synthase (maltosyl-transferring)